MQSMKNLGVVQFRPNCLDAGWKSWRGFGGQSLLQWVVRRATESQLLDGVIVVASSTANCAEISEMVPSDVPVFLSDRSDALGQFADALLHYSARNVVRICLEQPFIDPVMIDRLINLSIAQPNFDYIGFCNQSGMPTVETDLGSFAEFCKVKAVRIADREATSTLDRESVTRYLYTHPERYQVNLIQLPAELDRPNVRLSLTEPEDWDYLEDISEALGDELDWQRLTGYLANRNHARENRAAAWSN
jgi:spore coat polysaccharide biosynthesis protein SpsF (cytidylyltransferase family)